MATIYQASTVRRAADAESGRGAFRRRRRIGPLPAIIALALASWIVFVAIAIEVYRMSA